MQIELTKTILMTRLCDLLRNSTIYFCMYLYLVTYFVRVTVSSQCRLTSSNNFVSFANKIGINWNKIFVLY